jgi:hypothetical protein
MPRPSGWGLPGACGSSRGWLSARRGALALAAFVALSCGSPGEPFDSTAVRTISIAIDNTQLVVGTTVRARATMRDFEGHEVTDRVPAWLSLTPAVVSITQDGDITALQPGTGQIRASSGNAASDVIVIVQNPLAGHISLARDTATILLPGGAVQGIAAVTDEGGRPLVNPAVVWTSLHPAIALVNVAGLVTAVASGTATITASIDGLADTLIVIVRPSSAAGAPVVTSISPPILRPGGAYTITGNNFALTPGGNQVLVDGLLASVQTASATQLSVVLPTAGFACEAARDAFVQVGANGIAGGALFPLQTGTRVALEPGQSLVISDASAVRCNELVPGTGRWVISVYNAWRTTVGAGATGNVQFMVRGYPGAAIPGAPPAVRATPAAPEMEWITPPQPIRRRGSATDDAHLALLERNIAALRARPPSPPEAIRAPDATARRELTTVGAITNVRLPNLDGADFCINNIPFGARTVFAGPHAVILEDTITTFNGRTTLKGQMDDYYVRLGNEFEQVMWPILTGSFGNPLAMDAQLSNLGRVVMLFSPRVNAMQRGSIAGFVANCDFSPVGAKPSSNGGAFFYAIVPTGTLLGYATSDTRDQWLRQMRSTVIHEVKHVVSFAERLSRNFALEDGNWEEGGARAAEEMYSRTVYATAPRANTGYAASIGCDIRFAAPVAPCGDRPVLMLRHFDALYSFMTGPEIYSPLGRGFTGDFNYYAGAWSFLRWAADHFAPDEGQFFRDFTTSVVTGVANVEVRTGRRWEESLGEWSLAAYVDDIGGYTPNNQRLQMRSWNYPDIWLGMCVDMGPCVNPSNPVLNYSRSNPFAPRQRSFGNFLVGVGAMVGGGFTLLDLSGAGYASQVVEVKALLGTGDAPATVRIAIARVR